MDDLMALFTVCACRCINDDQAENTSEYTEDDRKQIDKWVAHDTHCKMQACCEKSDTDDGNCRAYPSEIRALVRKMLLGISQLVFFFAVGLPGQVLDLLHPNGWWFLIVYPKCVHTK